VEWLKVKALSSSPSTTKKKEKRTFWGDISYLNHNIVEVIENKRLDNKTMK
jgi:hypothetical protein